MEIREYQNKNGTEQKDFAVSFGVFALLTIIEIILLKNGYLESDGYTVSISSIVLSCIIYLIMLILTYIIYFKPPKKTALMRTFYNTYN